MREQWVEIAACALLAVGCLAIAGWALVTGQMSAQGVDGLFLILISLLLAAAFSIPLLQALREGMLNDLLRFRKKAAPQSAAPQMDQPRELAQNSSKSS